MLLILVILIALGIALTYVILDSALGRALARRIEGGAPRGAIQADRLAALEGEVERLSRELERLDQESEFLRRLVEERPKGGALPPGGHDD